MLWVKGSKNKSINKGTSMLFSTVQYLNFKKPNSIIYRTQTSVICFIVFAHKIEQRTVDMFLWNNSGSYWETSSGDIWCFCKWEIGPFSFRILWIYTLKIWGEVCVDGFLSFLSLSLLFFPSLPLSFLFPFFPFSFLLSISFLLFFTMLKVLSISLARDLGKKTYLCPLPGGLALKIKSVEDSLDHYGSWVSLRIKQVTKLSESRWLQNWACG